MRHADTSDISLCSQFILVFQAWVRSYAPVRQLSPNDLFCIMEWSGSGVDAKELTDHFDRFLSRNPQFMKDGFRLSALRFEADHFILSRRQKNADHNREPLQVYDPFVGLLACIAKRGQEQENMLVREAMRTMWRNIREIQQQALLQYASWQTSATEFYHLKALAILANREQCEVLFSRCLELLTPEERSSFDVLTPEERLHHLFLGSEAAREYRAMRHDQKVAEYFHLAEVFHYFD